MRRATAVVAIVLACTGTGSAGTPAGPTLRLVELSPVVVAGVGFPAGRPVRLLVRAPGLRAQKTVRAGPGGGFRVVVERLRLAGGLRCAAGVVVSARTEAGRVVLWRPDGLPDCSSPLRPPSV
jgi:hypothetical protein